MAEIKIALITTRGYNAFKLGCRSSITRYASTQKMKRQSKIFFDCDLIRVTSIPCDEIFLKNSRPINERRKIYIPRSDVIAPNLPISVVVKRVGRMMVDIRPENIERRFCQ